MNSRYWIVEKKFVLKLHTQLYHRKKSKLLYQFPLAAHESLAHNGVIIGQDVNTPFIIPIEVLETESV